MSIITRIVFLGEANGRNGTPLSLCKPNSRLFVTTAFGDIINERSKITTNVECLKQLRNLSNQQIMSRNVGQRDARSV